MRYYLTARLLSDATFGRGEGVAGLVDIEVEHDAHGCPQIGGRTLKGLLVEEWANLRYALRQIGRPLDPWDAAADVLFGSSGGGDAGGARLHIGAAGLPPDLHAAIVAERAQTPAQVLASLTTIRRQTSVDATSGAPEPGSLRAARAVIRGVALVAPLDLRLPGSGLRQTDEPASSTGSVGRQNAAAGLNEHPHAGGISQPQATTRLPDDEWLRAEALLAACALGLRRGGLSRNRGRGRLALLLHRELPADEGDAAFTRDCFERFAAEVRA